MLLILIALVVVCIVFVFFLRLAVNVTRGAILTFSIRIHRVVLIIIVRVLDSATVCKI
ncbi:hypothetical protein PI125_g12950 [Phytophthora idaei]|nr:hypothetical protein PI125_g12950 [Phytophthora idaei]KAG3134127.1 hypothetical protein PI126_g18841 [Phytophthora idaei]